MFNKSLPITKGKVRPVLSNAEGMGSSNPLFNLPLNKVENTLFRHPLSIRRLPQELTHCPQFLAAQQVHMQVGDLLP